MNILLKYRIQNFFLQKPGTWTDSSGKPLNGKCTHTTWKINMDLSWADLGNPLLCRLKERRQPPKHHSYHPMAPLPCSNMRLFLPYVLVLLQTSTYGHCPPHPFSFRLAQASFESNLYLYKYPKNLIPVVILVHTTYEDGSDSVPKCRHIKFRCRGIPQKKEYNIIIIIIINALVIQHIYIYKHCRLCL